nr:DEAD/DEAH box helicase [Pedobacter sp. SYSU D00535]
MGYKEPTAIQQQAIPVILEGKDLIACAQTGTGKTASYLLPLLELISREDENEISALVLAPTRELAQQIDQQVEGLAYYADISSVAIFGGGDGKVYEQQRSAIQNKVNILIATPGRLIAHLSSGFLKLDHLKYLVLDEADRMLDMGFQEDLMRIMSYLPKTRQTLLFSATMPPKIRTLARSVLNNPEQINLALSQPAIGIDQQVYFVYDEQKIPLIQHILSEGKYNSGIIFASTKEKVKELYKKLKVPAIKVRSFHSDLEQAEREEILLQFRNRQIALLIGTDVISRGIDVEGIELVINYDCPSDPEDYIHRIGRTARAERTGTAITLVNEKDQRKLKNIERLIDREVPKATLPEHLGEPPVFKPVEKKKKSGNQKHKRFFKSKNQKARQGS